MKKVKISELPLYNSLKGLFTLGTDKDNRSVKVSLEFIETMTEAAKQTAENAAKVATDAAANADKKAQAAQTAADNADAAAETATTAADNADKKAAAANTAAEAANKSKQEADKATEESKKATEAAQTATTEAQEATESARDATTAADDATASLVAFLGSILPTGLTVEDVPRLTVGNVYPVRINAVLSPEGVRQNIIYLSDNKAVTVAPDGRLTIVGKGRSTVHVIPTVNTALAKTLEVVVGEPTLRLVTRNSLRLTASGALRLN